VDVLLAALAGTSSTSRLHACTLTAPPKQGAIRFGAARFARDLATEGGAGLLLLDRGRNAVEHLHGLVLADAEVDVVGRWCELQRAARDAQRRRVVAGWQRFADDGDADLLRENLERVCAYDLKAPEVGTRDLERDVWSSGLLAEAWRVFVRSDGPEPVPVPRTPHARSKALARGDGDRTCGWCGRTIPATKRSHSQWCRPGCRVSACRARRRERAS